MNNIIECENLTHYYGDRCIYENLSFAVPKGRILGLLGKNGTGKTTTINILNGYLKARSGECTMFGEDSNNLSPQTKEKIGLLIEGHVQYSFMNIVQIEKFYAPFYPKWKKEAYFELMKKLKIAPNQKISSMSYGQRSQVALGLILAQDPELLILDDFSMGLDPGYRRLFIDYLSDYTSAEDKTVFVTSHIIQDMERLIDDCLILDYGKIIIQESVGNLLHDFRKYTIDINKEIPLDKDVFISTELVKNKLETYSFASTEQLQGDLRRLGVQDCNIVDESLNLEDAFIGLTGKY